ncbi:hypothetical protein D3C78_1360640 [compost metagenome]
MSRQEARLLVPTLAMQASRAMLPKQQDILHLHSQAPRVYTSNKTPNISTQSRCNLQWPRQQHWPEMHDH